MKKINYIQPNVRVVQIKRQPILAGSEQIPTSEGAADEWGAKQSGGFWNDGLDDEE